MSGLDELRGEELIALVLKLHEGTQSQAERISQLEEEISRLSGPKSKRAWVKPNALKKEKGPRKKRMQSFGRQSLPATAVLYHAVESCPDCGRKLSGGSVKWRHQVMEIPEFHIEVTDHLFVERRCGVCVENAGVPMRARCWVRWLRARGRLESDL